MSPSIFKHIKSMLNKFCPKSLAKSIDEGNIETFNHIWVSLSHENKEKFITIDNYINFHTAAENGRIDIINCYLTHITETSEKLAAKEAMLCAFNAREAEGFKKALQNQHWDIVERFLTEEYLHSVCLDIIQASDEFLELIWNSRLQKAMILIFNNACHQNTNEVKRVLRAVPESDYHLLLMTEIVEFPNFQLKIISPFQAACRQGNINLIKFVWSLYDNRVKKGLMNSLFPLCLIEAAKHGHANVIKKLLEWLSPEQQTQLLGYEDFTSLVHAADKGFDHIIELIWGYIPTNARITAISANNYAAYRLAKRNNHVNTVELLETIVPPHLKSKMQKAPLEAIEN